MLTIYTRHSLSQSVFNFFFRDCLFPITPPRYLNFTNESIYRYAYVIVITDLSLKAEKEIFSDLNQEVRAVGLEVNQ